MAELGTDLAFATWRDAGEDREDPGYFLPSTLKLEDSLQRSGSVRLDDLVDFVSTRFKPDGTSFPYIDIGSIDNRTGSIRPTEIESDEAPSRARYIVTAGDLLVSSVRPERGIVGRVPAELDGAIASSGFFVLRAKNRDVDTADALYLYFLTDHFRLQAVRRAASSMYPVINEAELRTILVPARELEDASEAVRALRAADAALAKASAELAKAKNWVSRQTAI